MLVDFDELGISPRVSPESIIPGIGGKYQNKISVLSGPRRLFKVGPALAKMFRRFWNASAYQKTKKTLTAAAVATVGVAAYQGWVLRDRYLREGKLDPPTGPTAGLERWIAQVRAAKDEVMDAMTSDDNAIGRGVHKVKELKDDFVEAITTNDNLVTKGVSRAKELKDDLVDAITSGDNVVARTVHKAKDIWEDVDSVRAGREKPTNTTVGVKFTADDKSAPHPVVKLVVIGDSLVAGVGNDDPQASPVLPHMIAASLGKHLQADVWWISTGIVGGTVVDQREKALPQIREKLEKLKSTSPVGDNVQYVVVVTSGLNDWKSVFIDFPSGLWPWKYEANLKILVEDIVELCTHDGNSCHVFLPNLPLVCIKSDPMYIMGVQPLGFFVDTMSSIWDARKQRVADEAPQVPARYYHSGRRPVEPNAFALNHRWCTSSAARWKTQNTRRRAAAM